MMLPLSRLTMGGIVTTPAQKVSPLFVGKELPRPPKQKSVWAPPKSSLPTNYVTGTALLYEQGLADPRNCDYREIEVGTGSAWYGDGGLVRTHGWVLPGRAKRRFAICWNGLVYPAVSIGANVDLDADVAMLITNGIVSWQSAVPESMSVSVNTLQGIRGCLLLRLGRADRAADFWRAQARREAGRWNSMMRRFPRAGDIVSTNETKLLDGDPYLDWASDWAWALFDRMICAHMRGDENLALADARELGAAQLQIEAACAQRGFKRQTYSDSQNRGLEQPYLDFLGQLPQLLADLERREKEGPRKSVIARGLTNITNQAERVKALVHDLDLVQARQWSQPGGVNLADDSIVSALIGEGDAAVDPLLDCCKNDKRMTRSVSFGRDFHRGRAVMTVGKAAWFALQSILQAEFSNASEMGAYWAKYKHLKLEDRWYAILNDDNARDRWQEAAANIVQPENVTRFAGRFSMVTPAQTNAPVRLRGECLHDRSNPSVTELLARHALEAPANKSGAYDLSSCCQMAEFLARWDVKAALPVAKTLSRRASTVMKYSDQHLGGIVTELSMARWQAGDPTAFNDYAEWIVSTAPEQFEQPDLTCLEPLRKFPTNAALQGVAEKLFGPANAAWGSLPWKSEFVRGTVEPALVEMPAYRSLLCRGLEKTNAFGTVSLERSGYLQYKFADLRRSGGFGVTLPKTSLATNGSTADIRWCDWIALDLATQGQVEPFDPFAPQEQRDKAIQKLILQLKTRGK